MGNKAREGRGEAIGHLTSDLCVVAGTVEGQRTQQPRLISNYTLGTTYKYTERERKAQPNSVQLKSNLSA